MTEKLKIGIIGLGFMGQTHYNNIFDHPQAEVTAIFTLGDLDLKTRATVFSEWAELIDQSGVEAVVIATPTDTHAEIACYAARQGKHIFLEKPMARTLGQCEDIRAIEAKCGVKVFPGHVLRFWPTYGAVQQHLAIHPEQLGPIKLMSFLRAGGYPNWGNWFALVEKSGGVVLDLSIHDIDYATWLFGNTPVSVSCTTQLVRRHSAEIPAISSTVLNYEGGTAYCAASWAGSEAFPFSTAAEIVGTEGILRFNNDSPPTVTVGDTTFAVPPNPMDGYQAEMDSFIQCILEGTPPAVTTEDGLNAVRICLAAIESAKKQKPIQL